MECDPDGMNKEPMSVMWSDTDSGVCLCVCARGS